MSGWDIAAVLGALAVLTVAVAAPGLRRLKQRQREALTDQAQTLAEVLRNTVTTWVRYAETERRIRGVLGFDDAAMWARDRELELRRRAPPEPPHLVEKNAE